MAGARQPLAPPSPRPPLGAFPTHTALTTHDGRQNPETVQLPLCAYSALVVTLVTRLTMKPRLPLPPTNPHSITDERVFAPPRPNISFCGHCPNISLLLSAAVCCCSQSLLTPAPSLRDQMVKNHEPRLPQANAEPVGRHGREDTHEPTLRSLAQCVTEP